MGWERKGGVGAENMKIVYSCDAVHGAAGARSV